MAGIVGHTGRDSAPALIKRAEKTVEDAKLVLNAPIPDLPKENAASALHKCAALWVAIDKLMGSLENIIVTSQTSLVPSDSEKPLKDIVQTAVSTGAELEQHLRNVVAVMQKSALIEARNLPADSSHAKRAKNLAAFYQTLLSKSSFLYNLADAHPLLENAIRKRLAEKSPKDAGGQKQV